MFVFICIISCFRQCVCLFVSLFFLRFSKFRAAGVFLANLAVIASQIGTHVVHALFISGVLNQFVPTVPRYAWILILSPLFVLLSWIRDVSHLRWPSTFGVLLLVVAVMCVFV